jgi:hypothetical protein
MGKFNRNQEVRFITTLDMAIIIQLFDKFWAGDPGGIKRQINRF